MTASTENQRVRISKFLDKVESASNLGDIVLIGDFNINLDPTNDIEDTWNTELKYKLLDTLPILRFNQMIKKY